MSCHTSGSFKHLHFQRDRMETSTEALPHEVNVQRIAGNEGVEILLCCDRTKSIPEWTILELQGSIEPPRSVNGLMEDFGGLHFGNISLSNKA